MNLFIRNISQLVTVAAGGAASKPGAGMRELGILTDAAVLCRNGTIAWVGKTADWSGIIPDDMTVIDAAGSVVLPGFVDSHTHMMFAGDRADEFGLRSSGATYQQIAEGGGGILKTVRAVRTADKRTLKRSASRYLADMMRHGTTTVEVKSGYGLTPESETRMLEAIHELGEEELATVVPTFMGAHALPPEYGNDRAGYVGLVTDIMIPHVGRRKLARFCDVFCENGYFSVEESERILQEGKAWGLAPKVHADELSPSGGAELAARIGAVSADHLENVSRAGIEALAAAGVVATLLPGVSFFLRHGYADARRMIDAGVAIALSTDFNPGSCMSYSMPLMMTIACTQMRLTPEEAITAATLHGAAALGLSDRVGSIEVGKRADMIILDLPDYRHLAYHFGINHVRRTIVGGTLLEF